MTIRRLIFQTPFLSNQIMRTESSIPLMKTQIKVTSFCPKILQMFSTCHLSHNRSYHRNQITNISRSLSLQTSQAFMTTISQPAPKITCQNGSQNVTVVPFYSNACGNTFLVYDCTDVSLSAADWELLKKTIWNSLSIQVRGAPIDDALVLRTVDRSPTQLNVKMHVLEPDHTEADFCGNGARAVGTFLLQKYSNTFSSMNLVSRRGLHPIIDRNGICFIDMGIPKILDQLSFPFKGRSVALTYVDAIEPHLVTRDIFDSTLLTELGKAINQQWKAKFPNGINVNCVKVNEPSESLAKPLVQPIDVMTYERGVYRITQACGTGSTACCAASQHHNWLPMQETYHVNVPGGKLQLIYQEKSRNFLLGGDVKFAHFSH